MRHASMTMMDEMVNHAATSRTTTSIMLAASLVATCMLVAWQRGFDIEARAIQELRPEYHVRWANDTTSSNVSLVKPGSDIVINTTFPESLTLLMEALPEETSPPPPLSDAQLDQIRNETLTYFGFGPTHPCASPAIAPELLLVLRQAKAKPTALACRAELPGLWDRITARFGRAPHIVGRDTCQAYRDEARRRNVTAKIGIAGLYNSGTNAFRLTLHKNIKFNDGGIDAADLEYYRHTKNRTIYPPLINDGSYGHVHRPDRIGGVRYHKHRVPHELNPHLIRQLSEDGVLVVVIVREPLHWMLGMCKTPYYVNNTHDYGPCPRIWSMNGVNDSHFNEPARIKEFSKVEAKYGSYYDSLAHYWAQFHQEYLLNVTFPRLMIRYEDLLFHGEATLQAIVDCVSWPPDGASGSGGPAAANVWLRRPYAPFRDPAKTHGNSVGLIDAMLKYTRPVLHNLTTAELQYISQQVLTPQLLHALGMPPLA